MKTTSKGFRKYDPNDANDKASNVAKWIADDSTYNMDLLDSQLVEYDEKIKNASNVTLDGERKQNFNFTLSSKGNSVSGLKVSTTITQIPKLYKESKTLRGTWTEIPYTETRDLANYNYKFM